jgi:hypothetical protein
MPVDILALIAITFVGATVNGALGYGFSSLTVPVALLFYTNRRLNPSLVLIEVVLNAHVLWTNRRAWPPSGGACCRSSSACCPAWPWAPGSCTKSIRGG